MKNLALILTLIFVVACSRPEKVLPKDDGRWGFTKIVTEEDTSYKVSGAYRFSPSGGGKVYIGSDSALMAWIVTGNRITVSEGGVAQSYEIVEKTNKMQIWQSPTTVVKLLRR